MKLITHFYSQGAKNPRLAAGMKAHLNTNFSAGIPRRLGREVVYEITKKHQWWLYFSGLILVFVVLTIYIWREGTNIFTNYADYSYHLAVAQGFIRAKGVVAWDFWESLPLGRPHNYPPFIHIILAMFLKMGFSVLTATKLIIEFVIVGGLILFSCGITKLFNIKYALIAAILLVSSSNFISVSSTTLPATFALFLSPIILYFTLEKKWLPLGAILVILFYTHLFIPYFILLALLIYLLIFNRKLILPFIKTALISLIFYLPWLIHVLVSGLSYIKYFDSSYATGDNIRSLIFGNIVVLVLFILSIFFFLHNRRHQTFHPIFFFIILSLLFLPSVLISPNRIINGHFITIIAIPATCLIYNIIIKKHFFNFLIYLSILVLFFWGTPYLLFHGLSKIRFYFQPTVFNRLVIVKHQTIPMEEKYKKLLTDIKNNSSPGGTITSALYEFDMVNVEPKYQIHVANFFASNISLATLNLRQPEIFHRSPPDLFSSRLILLNIPPKKFEVPNCQQVKITGYNIDCNKGKKLKLVDSYWTSGGSPIFLYRNDDINVVRETIPVFRFPLYLAELLSLSCLGLVIAGLIKKSTTMKWHC